jgi:hypothetical protein
VQWCHGAAGFIPTMVAAHTILGGGGAARSRYLDAAERAAGALWRRGLLKKGVGLCHGVAGGGFAFLSLWRATRDARHLAAAQQFALFAARRAEALYDVPDRPASLYEVKHFVFCFYVGRLSKHKAGRAQVCKRLQN